MVDLTRIRSRGGAPFTVSGAYAPKFQGLLDDLEAAGYAIDAGQSGGYNPRNIAGTNTPSNHAFGRAIDVNWTDNARGTQGKIDPKLAQELAAKHGMTWGGTWKNPDPMHFEVANGAPVPIGQRSLTGYAGLGGPKEEPAPSPTEQGAPMPQRPMMGAPAQGQGLFESLMNPMTMAGLTILGSRDRDVGRGLQTGMQMQEYQRKQAEEQQQRDAYQGLLSDPEVLKSLPSGAAKIAQAAGPKLGLGFISKAMDPNRDLDRRVKEAQIAKMQKEATEAGAAYGKTGTVVQGADGKFYSIQFASDGSKKVEPLQFSGGVQDGAQPNAAAPVPLTPSRGVDVVGNEMFDKGTGGFVRDVGGNLAEAERQKALGKGQGEGQLGLGKAETALKDYEIKNGLVMGEIDRAIDQASGFTTGFAGAFGSYVPGTPAHDLSKTLNGIQSNLGFDTLQQMRENSPTGGALGSITERELELLQSTWGSLVQSQSEAQFRHNLNRLKQIKTEYAKLKRDAYQRDVQRFGAGNVPNPAGAPTTPQAPANGGWSIKRVD